MSAFNPHNSGEAVANDHDADHGHDHPPHLAHHFDTPEQQYDSAKIGMWIFLATEILMFGGLFCAYAVYRFNNPDVFRYSEHHLNTALGATNTVILLASSLTMALGVRAAQLGQQTRLKAMLALTLLGGVGFMVIKAVEYTDKFTHGIVPGRYNLYDKGTGKETYFTGFSGFAEHSEGGESTVATEGSTEQPPNSTATAATAPATQSGDAGPPRPADLPGDDRADDGQTMMSTAPLSAYSPTYIDPNAGGSDAALVRPRFAAGTGIHVETHAAGDTHAGPEYEELSNEDRSRVKSFFSIYFLMTGLHGLHVLVGMGLISWVYVKAASGVFGPGYFTPVDIVGLYWHLVDLIWIFLFPLLYLIH